ncbi:uncharacterized protein FOMMEDRAFT_144298 [Fomitiporia mediterranea MF3/22]|uniref:uncharacterized protein n=1 Tax=Fomitiporia mediterranea (strain MF3/22) TaxID=694068 RepID=UPI0004407A1F|nr:uncharacterized protein FOMMEDRAFT_144298 [Fomitiporia mediterranea MF3/22]EJD08365.1 hypothetical protein FOMMEDRAFT_144298 [Fomitiporia mediterranea MF3/22]
MTLPVQSNARSTASANPKGSNISPQSPCTHTFDEWRTFSTSYSAQRTVSGKYGVDFRFAPEPNGDERRALKLLDIATKCLGPRAIKKNAERFDYVENYSARTNHAYPCATPSAHIQGAQAPGKGVAQADPSSSSPSSSRSKTPRASPTDLDHLAFFNFPDDVTPGPPDKDVEHEHDTDPDTDTGSERELRIEDLEAPFALQQLGRNLTVRGRQRGRRRDRAESTSTSTTGSGSGSGSAPGFAPMAALTPPTANRTNINTGSTSLPTPTHVTPTAPATSNQSSPLRPVYGRRGPSAVSESGAGTIGGAGSPSDFGVGLSAAARARERARGIGTPRSEPDSSLAMGMRALPTGAMSGSSLGAFNVGAYGYRYPAHPPYPPSSATTGIVQNTGAGANANIQAVTGISTSATQRQGNTYASQYRGQGGSKIPNYSLGSIKAEDTSLSALQRQAYTSPFAANSNINQNQRWAGASTTTGTTATEDMGMDMDIDMGGWARVSDPLPGMNFSEMIASTPYASGQNQTQSQSQSRIAYGPGPAHAYQQQQQQTQYAVHAQQQMSYGVPQAHQQDVQMSYYASPMMSNPSPSMTSSSTMSTNPGLNMSPSRWKASNTSPSTQVTMSSSSAVMGQSRAQSLGQGQGRTGYWPTSDMRSGN